MRQGGHDDVGILPLPDGAHFYRTRTAEVHGKQVPARRNDLRLGRKVRPLNILQQFLGRTPRRLQQPDARGGDLPEVMRRNIRRHAHGNARSPVQQDIGQARRQ